MNPAGEAVDVGTLPWPGDELVFRVAGGTDREHFYNSGRQSIRDFEVMLSLVGTTMSSYRSILDFGCGCGRIMLWLEELASTASLHGVDIDALAIDWARDHIPWATVTVNQPLPPLDYPDHHFDLVFNHSVFTHIDEEYQDRWLNELRRVTKPGAHLLLSVHGDSAFRAFEDWMRSAGRDPGPVREERARNGIVHVRDDNFVGGPFPDFYHSTFHAPWYVQEHWARYFTVVGYAARRSLGFQDLVLLERGTEPATTIGAGPSPRQEARLGGTPSELRSALDEVWSRLDAGPDVRSPARLPALAMPVRRLVLRALRHYTDHQRTVDAALARAIARLEPDTASPDAQIWQALRTQGERVNRLEADLWAAVRAGAEGDPADDSASSEGRPSAG